MREVPPPAAHCAAYTHPITARLVPTLWHCAVPCRAAQAQQAAEAAQALEASKVAAASKAQAGKPSSSGNGQTPSSIGAGAGTSNGHSASTSGRGGSSGSSAILAAVGAITRRRWGRREVWVPRQGGRGQCWGAECK